MTRSLAIGRQLSYEEIESGCVRGHLVYTMFHTNLPALSGAGAGLLGLEVAGAFWEIRKMFII